MVTNFLAISGGIILLIANMPIPLGVISRMLVAFLGVILMMSALFFI